MYSKKRWADFVGLARVIPPFQVFSRCTEKLFALFEYGSHVDPMKTTQTPVAILVRVSSTQQETDRQVSELTSYAESKGYKIVSVLKEKISGTASQDRREGLNEALELARTGKIKMVLVHEVSRIARRNSIAHKFVESLEDYGVSLYWHSQGVSTILPNGKRNPAAGIMLALMAEMARNELEVLKMRVRSGILECRRKGIKLGRPVGTTENLLEKHKDIVRLLKNGQSVRNTAKIAGKAFSTVQRVKKVWKMESLPVVA